MPAGMPMRRMPASSGPQMRSSRRCRRKGPSSRIRNATTMTALRAAAMTVAMPMPAVPQPNRRTKARSRTKFTTTAAARAYSGRFASPWARSSADPKL